MKSKSIPLIISLSAIFSFCSCQNESPVLRVGFSQCSDDEWRQQLNREFSREMLFHPEVEFEIVSAGDDNGRQIADIERFIEEDMDAIVVAPNEADAITPVIEKAYGSGIPVILVDRKINSDKYTAYIGADNEELGYRGGQYVADLSMAGDVVEITGAEASTPAAERHKGFSEALKDSPVRLHQIESDWTYDDAYDRFRRYLLAGGKADVVFAHNDKMALAARKAAENVKRCESAVYIGVDALAGDGLGVDMVEKGILNASLMYPTGGDAVARLVMAVLEDVPHLRNNVLVSDLVTQSNARILKMQYSNIEGLDRRIRTMNELLSSSMMNYRNQRKVLVAAFILLVLVLALLVAAVWAVLKMRRMNGQLEEQKRQIERQREEKLAFFTNVSHDFRTPLTLIADPVNRLKKSPGLSGSDRFLLDLVGKNVTLLQRLVNQILDFRKYECGKLDLHLSEFDLPVALKDWTDSFSDIAGKKHINLRLEPDTGSGNIVADMEKLERIVYNLLSNALKFTPEAGEVTVGLVSEDETYHISVSDNGVGIPPDKINHIFENFYQAHSVSYSGSGIGLSLVKAFVDMHSGSVTVTGRDGGGTVFDVIIPKHQPGYIYGSGTENSPETARAGAVYEAGENMSAGDPFSEGWEKDGNGATVLVIDDNSDVRTYICSVLKPYYDVLEAANGEEGMKLAMKYLPDAVVCDVMMPVMNGMEFCSRLKSDMRTAHIPVMMLTAYAAEDQKIEGYNCGADSYISKPFGSDLLLVRLKNLLENRARLQDFYSDSTHAGGERISSADKDFISQLRAAVLERIDDSTLSVEELGGKMCLSRVQLYRKVKALTGYSPNEFIRILRLRKASELLASSDKTVAETAYSVGFTSPSYFARCYRDYFGELPGDIRKKV